MNKTVSINLGGFFFHIDEDAYQKLNRYFDAIRRSLSPDGKDEIMSDIEARIAELLTEKLKNDKQVVGQREIDEVISVMGQPEDYRIDEETKDTGKSYKAPEYAYTKTKKLYRDSDRALIGGVSAGLAHYFRIDPLWIRILFIISPFVSFGTSIVAYILLWILIPRAVTTSEKLEMTGEPINISNIEKKVKEEFSQISDRLNNVDYDKLGTNVKNGAEKLGTGISTIVLGILKAFAKIIGAIITVFSALSLGGILILLIVVLFSTAMARAAWYPYFHSMNYTDVPLWIVAITGFFAIAIPLFALFLLGLKILVDNLKPVGDLTKYTLLILWIVAISAAIYLGVLQSSEFGNEGKTVVRQEINLAKTDTLNIKFRYNDYFSKSLYHDYDFSFKQDSLGNEVIYSNQVTFYVYKTDEAQPYIKIDKIADGSSMAQARKSAEKIKYNFKIEGNNLILDNYLLTGTESKYRRQRIEIFLYLPEGTYFKPDKSLQEYDETDNQFFDLWFDGDNYIYQMDRDNVKCLNCVAKEEGGDNGDEVGNNDLQHPDADNNNGRHKSETIRIMELEAERARMETERLKMEHEFQKDLIQQNREKQNKTNNQ